MNRVLYQAVNIEYFGNPTVTVSVDGSAVLSDHALPSQTTFRKRRVTLPVATSGFISHLVSTSTNLLNQDFEAVPIESFNQQQLFHYYEFGFRGAGQLQPKIYLDGTEQTENLGNGVNTLQVVETMRLYFNPLAYGYVPHIHNAGTSDVDAEILWARPVALPPRFYRGIRTHSEFQITYKGDVDIQWFLDGESIGTYNFNSQTTIDNQSVFVTETKKDYFQSGTIGHVLQYKHTNPEGGGKVYMIETDITLGDLEQQAMSPQVEG